MFWTSHKVNHTSTCGLKYTTLRLRTQRSAPSNVHRATQERTLARGSPYMCPSPLLMIRRITQRRLWPTRLCKGELASPSRYTSLFTTLLTHSFSVPLLTWVLEPAGTLRSTAKSHSYHTRSRHHHTGAFSVVIATQPFSPDISFGTRGRGSFAKPLRSNDPPS